MFTSNNGIFDTSVKTDCIIARLVLVGWVISFMLTDTLVHKMKRIYCMKYANRLTDEELREVYGLFIDSDGKINELNIVRDESSIELDGYIEVSDFDKERLKENPNATIIIDDDYEITDYEVTVYHHSGDCTQSYRKWMYEKFGDEYARDYLFNA